MAGQDLVDDLLDDGGAAETLVMMRGGTWPLRKPGMLTCPAISLYALSISDFSSSKGTSTVRRTLVGSRVSTVLFTCVRSVVYEFGNAHFGRITTRLVYATTPLMSSFAGH